MDDDEGEVVGENGKAIVPMNNRKVMENKWENGRVAHHATAIKRTTTWMGIFSTRGDKKEGGYKLMLDEQKERMNLGPRKGEEEVTNLEQQVDN